MADALEDQQRAFQLEREVSGLSEAISAQHAALQAAGASHGNALTAHAELGDYAGVDGGERELAAAWKRLAQLGRERTALRSELAGINQPPATIGLRNLDRAERFCGQCGDVLQDRRSTRSYCSNACRQQAYRDAKRLTVTVT